MKCNMNGRLRVFGVFLILLAIQKLEGKALREDGQEEQAEGQRVKRGYSKYGENDFGSTIHVSSGVLQYGSHDETPTIDISNSYDHNPWQPSGPPPGYDVWQQPSQSYHPSSSVDISDISISSIHPGSDHISNSVFSTDSHVSGVELPHSSSSSSDGVGSQGLHTQISSSSGISSLDDGDIDIGHHAAEHISDNIDFHNIADIKSKHYTKSYGK